MPSQPPELYGRQISEIAQKCKVSLKTAGRWKAGQSVPPESALMIMRRDLGAFHKDWSGWKISERGELCSPENWVATPGTVRGLEIHQALVKSLRHEVQSLRQQLRSEEMDRFEEQPMPNQWELINWGSMVG